MNEIQWQSKALKQLEKIKQVAIRQMVYTQAQNLALFPACHNVKKLVNHKYQYRLRAGNYRVFFNVDGNIHIVYIEEVKKRDDNTY